MTMYKIKPLKTYIFLVVEDLELVQKLINFEKKNPTPFYPDSEPFYRSKARHIQIMAIMGLTGEFLIKAILLKRKFSIREVDYIKKDSKKKDSIKFLNKTISFSKAIKLFKQSSQSGYFKNVRPYNFTDNYQYMGRNNIDPQSCLTLLQNIRNNYVHKAEAHGEMNGIIWYIYNFLVWLAKKEFPRQFKAEKFIGNKEIIELFQK